MVCPKCGKEVGDARFCTGCGNVMASAQPQQSAPVAPAAPVNQVNFNTPAPAAQPPQKDSKKTIIIAVAAVVIVLIIAVAAVVILMNNNSKDDDDDKKTKDKTKTVTTTTEMNYEELNDFIFESDEEAYEDEEYDNTGADYSSLSDDDFEVFNYLYDDYGTTDDFVVITNNSDIAVKVEIMATAWSEDGNDLGDAENSIEVLGPGETSVCWLTFRDVSGVDSVGHSFTYSEPEYSSIIDDLDVETEYYDDYVSVSVTNTGDKTAEYVDAYVFFFDEDGFITDWSLISFSVDDDYELMPDYTVSDIAYCSEGYCSAEVYIRTCAE